MDTDEEAVVVDVPPESGAAEPEPEKPQLSDEELAAQLAECQRRTREQYAREEAEHSKRLKGVIERLGASGPTRINLPDPIEEEERRQRAEEAKAQREAEYRQVVEERRIEADRTWPLTAAPRFRHAHVDNLDGSSAPKILEWLGLEPQPNLIVIGPTGVGKTYLAYALMRWFETRRKTVRLQSLAALLDDLRPGADAEANFIAAKEADLLVIDDVGVERQTDWSNERLYLIIDHRWTWELPTVITTNLAIDGLAAVVGQRLFSRLTHDCRVVEVDGLDRRQP